MYVHLYLSSDKFLSISALRFLIYLRSRAEQRQTHFALPSITQHLQNVSMFYKLPRRIWQWFSLSACVSRSCGVFLFVFVLCHGNDTCCCFTTFSVFQIGTAEIISYGVVIVVEMEALILNNKPFLQYGAILPVTIPLSSLLASRLPVCSCLLCVKLHFPHRDFALSAVLTQPDNKHKRNKDRGNTRAVGGGLLPLRQYNLIFFATQKAKFF